MKINEAITFETDVSPIQESFFDIIRNVATGAGLIGAGIAVGVFAGGPVGAGTGFVLGKIFSLFGLVPISAYIGAGLGFAASDYLKENVEEFATQAPLDQLLSNIKKRDAILHDIAKKIDNGVDPSTLKSLTSQAESLTREQKQIGAKLERTVKADHDAGLMDRRKYSRLSNMAKVAKDGKLTTMKTK